MSFEQRGGLPHCGLCKYSGLAKKPRRPYTGILDRIDHSVECLCDALQVAWATTALSNRCSGILDLVAPAAIWQPTKLKPSSLSSLCRKCFDAESAIVPEVSEKKIVSINLLSQPNTLLGN